MNRPRVILDPSFRTVNEIFDDETLGRLQGRAHVVWGRDESMPTSDLIAEIATADGVIFGEWRHGRDGLDTAGERLVALLEVAGGHEHPAPIARKR